MASAGMVWKTDGVFSSFWSSEKNQSYGSRYCAPCNAWSGGKFLVFKLNWFHLCLLFLTPSREKFSHQVSSQNRLVTRENGPSIGNKRRDSMVFLLTYVNYLSHVFNMTLLKTESSVIFLLLTCLFESICSIVIKTCE